MPAAKSAKTTPKEAGRKPDDPKQYQRFLDAAEEAEATKTAKDADKAFRSVVKPRKSKAK